MKRDPYFKKGDIVEHVTGNEVLSRGERCTVIQTWLNNSVYLCVLVENAAGKIRSGRAREFQFYVDRKETLYNELF